MKYFAKYLPVEGEIKKGSIVTRKEIGGGNLKVFKEFKNSVNVAFPDEQGPIEFDLEKKSELNLMKLFLCSRDIQVGDKVRVEWNDGIITKEVFQQKNHWLKTEPVYKVIGEISPNAIWVKEGDEFDAEEIQCRPHPEEVLNQVSIKEALRRNYKAITCYLQCPTCKTFH